MVPGEAWENMSPDPGIVALEAKRAQAQRRPAPDQRHGKRAADPRSHHVD